MPWLESTDVFEKYVPPPILKAWRYLWGLRASPKLLVAVCILQLLVLMVGMLQQLNRTECAIAVPVNAPVTVECDTCRHVSISMRGVLINVGGAAVIGCGILAVAWRDQRLLYVYGSTMLFFALIIGLTAMLTALEAPVLEVAVSGVSTLDDDCIDLAESMLTSARHHAQLASLGCLVDTAGAILAIRSRELFSYEEIASQHAEVRARMRSRGCCRRCHARRIALCGNTDLHLSGTCVLTPAARTIPSTGEPRTDALAVTTAEAAVSRDQRCSALPTSRRSSTPHFRHHRIALSARVALAS